MAEGATPRRNRLLLAQWAELLESDAYRRFWLMRLASHGAANAVTYALLVFTVRQSASALATGGLLLTLIVPSAVFGAVAGVVVDRLPRGLILFLSNIGRALLAFALIGAKDSLPSIYAVSLGFGLILQFAMPAEAAVVPHIVRPTKLVAANSFINLGTLVSQVLGILVLAPILLKTTDGAPLLFLLVALFGFAAVITTVIPQFHFAPQNDGRGRVTISAARREFAESWQTLSRDSTAFLGLTLLVVTSISIVIMATLLPKFGTSVLAIAPENLVYVLAPTAVGVFLGLRSVEYLADRFDKLATISGAYLLMAGSLIALGLVPATGDFLVSVDPAGLFSAGPLNEQSARIAATAAYANLYGFALTVVMTMGRTLLNERIPLAMQGRIFAAQAVLANMTAILPVVLAGLLADAIGVGVVLIAAGIAAVFAAAWSRARTSKLYAQSP